MKSTPSRPLGSTQACFLNQVFAWNFNDLIGKENTDSGYRKEIPPVVKLNGSIPIKLA